MTKCKLAEKRKQVETIFKFLSGKTFSVNFTTLFPKLPPFGKNHKVTVIMLSTLYELLSHLEEELKPKQPTEH